MESSRPDLKAEVETSSSNTDPSSPLTMEEIEDFFYALLRAYVKEAVLLEGQSGKTSFLKPIYETYYEFFLHHNKKNEKDNKKFFKEKFLLQELSNLQKKLYLLVAADITNTLTLESLNNIVEKIKAQIQNNVITWEKDEFKEFIERIHSHRERATHPDKASVAELKLANDAFNEAMQHQKDGDDTDAFKSFKDALDKLNKVIKNHQGFTRAVKEAPSYEISFAISIGKNIANLKSSTQPKDYKLSFDKAIQLLNNNFDFVLQRRELLMLLRSLYLEHLVVSGKEGDYAAIVRDSDELLKLYDLNNNELFRYKTVEFYLLALKFFNHYTQTPENQTKELHWLQLAESFIDTAKLSFQNYDPKLKAEYKINHQIDDASLMQVNMSILNLIIDHYREIKDDRRLLLYYQKMLETMDATQWGMSIKDNPGAYNKRFNLLLDLAQAYEKDKFYDEAASIFTKITELHENNSQDINTIYYYKALTVDMLYKEYESQLLQNSQNINTTENDEDEEDIDEDEDEDKLFTSIEKDAKECISYYDNLTDKKNAKPGIKISALIAHNVMVKAGVALKKNDWVANHFMSMLNILPTLNETAPQILDYVQNLITDIKNSLKSYLRIIILEKKYTLENVIKNLTNAIDYALETMTDNKLSQDLKDIKNQLNTLPNELQSNKGKRKFGVFTDESVSNDESSQPSPSKQGKLEQ